MKKIIIPLVVLVSFCIFIFFRAWVSFSIPANSYAVMVSKSGGVHQKLIEPGTFVWRWERLLPTNAKLLVFSLEPINQKISIDGKLPSADIFTAFSEAKPDFTWSIQINLSARTKPQKLIELVTNQKITDQQILNEWTQNHLKTLTQEIALKSITSVLNSPDFSYQNEQNPLFYIQAVKNSFNSIENDPLEFFEISDIDIRIPDFTLYSVLAQSFARYEEKRSSLLAETKAIAESKALQDKLVLERLSQWGELLDKHPSLLQLLSLTNGKTENLIQVIDAIR